MCISAAEHQDASLRRASHRKEDKAHIAAQLGDTQGRAFAIHGRHLRLDRVDMSRLHDLKLLPRDRPYAFDAPSSISSPCHVSATAAFASEADLFSQVSQRLIPLCTFFVLSAIPSSSPSPSRASVEARRPIPPTSHRSFRCGAVQMSTHCAVQLLLWRKQLLYRP